MSTKAILQTRDLAESVELDNIFWANEFSGYRPVATSTKTSLSGGLIVQEKQLKAGRPILFQDFWVTRAVLKILYDFVSRPEAEFKINLPDGRFFFVVFNDPQPLKARPVQGEIHVADSSDAELYHVTSLLMTTIE